MADVRLFPALIGNERIKNLLGGDILAGRLGHAYILEGPPGSGRRTAARAVAAAISCTGRNASDLPCGRCLSCRKIAEDISPDVLTVRREEDRATLGVNVIRTMRRDLWIAPNENEKKVYLIEEAERMTTEAQNALLLSLEEPPPFVVFFLLTTDAAALLETVRSRAPVLRMQRFTSQETADILKKERRFAALAQTDPDFFAQAIAASGGALGTARQMLSRSSSEAKEFGSRRADALEAVALLFRNDPAKCAQFLLSLPKEREAVAEMLSLMLLALRDLAAVKKRAEVPMLLYLHPEEAAAFCARIGISRIMAASRAVFAASEAIAANASVLPTCTALLMQKL